MNATDHLQASSPLGNPLQTLQAPNLTATHKVAGNALAGCWKLAPGQALTLHAPAAGVLRIAHGRVWVTFDHADDRASLRAGDYFLGRGQSLLLQAGESLVMESFGAGHAASAYFSWEPVPALQPAAAVSWRAGVVAPLADLRLAASLAGRALIDLTHGLWVGTGKALRAVVAGLLRRSATPWVWRRGGNPAVQADFDRLRHARRGDVNVNVLALSNLT